jgi:protein-tyrosine-phosphatase
MRTVLFVCTGNTCRSPMAEGIAQKMFDDGRFPAAVGALFFASAGVSSFAPSAKGSGVLSTYFTSLRGRRREVAGKGR